MTIYPLDSVIRNVEQLRTSNFPNGCHFQIPATADIKFFVRGLKADEKYMAAVAAYNEHGKLIGGSVGITCRPVLAAHPLPTLMAWGYLAQVRDKLQRDS